MTGSLSTRNGACNEFPYARKVRAMTTPSSKACFTTVRDAIAVVPTRPSGIRLFGLSAGALRSETLLRFNSACLGADYPTSSLARRSRAHIQVMLMVHIHVAVMLECLRKDRQRRPHVAEMDAKALASRAEILNDPEHVLTHLFPALQSRVHAPSFNDVSVRPFCSAVKG